MSLFGGEEITRQRLPGRFCIPVCLSRCPPQGDGGPLEFPGYPCVHMPRSQTPVVSSRLAMTPQGLMPSDSYRSSAFPSSHLVILSDHEYTIFGAQSRGLYTRYTWLHTHPLGYACRFTTVSAANFSGGNWAVACLHPLGSIIQFHKLLSDPKDLNLTRHDVLPVYAVAAVG